VFGNWASHGKLKAVEDDAAANQLELLIDLLEINGYEHYEISNFSIPGFISKHNSNYWKDKKFLGVGPSAHSYNGVSRQHNVANNYTYIESIELKRVPEKIEILSKEDKINEYLLTTLRTKWGTDLTKLKQDFGIDLLMSKAAYLAELQQHQLAVLEENVLVLTRKGKLLADKIASDLFVFLSQPIA
jgi:oxygen-independent coproporphyrinogen-3 oxidase